MRSAALRPWKLNIDKIYTPSISLIIPMHNEEKMVELKLENTYNIDYPEEKIQIILVDDASTDKTLERAIKFTNCHPKRHIQILKKGNRGGKSKALNFALKQTKGDIIVVSDADCFLAKDVFAKALPYLCDPSVGAVTGREILLLDSRKSWVTHTEMAYLESVHKIRLGESKVYSTIFFQGGFSAYKREFLDEFDDEIDDSGTALNIVQKRARTLLIDEAVYFTTFPVTWKGKVAIKTRRAGHLVKIWFKGLKLMLDRQFILPYRIAIPEIFLHILNPAFFVLFALTTFLLFLILPYFFLGLCLFLSALLISKYKYVFLEVIQNNFILITVLILSLVGNRVTLWETAEESRHFISRGLLERENLVQEREKTI